jgi:HEAT repeat protein
LTAASQVGEFGAEAESAIPALEKLLEDEWSSIREAAARSLKKIKQQKPGNDADQE